MNLSHQIDLSAHRPVMGVGTASYILRMDRERVCEAVEDGRLAWAWDFSVPPAKRRELRIWRGSVSAWLRSNGEDGADDAREEVVMADILPNRDFYTSELKRMLVLHRTTLQHFIELNFLAVMAQAPRDGVLNLASKIGRGSVVEFLRRKRVGWVAARQLVMRVE